MMQGVMVLVVVALVATTAAQSREFASPERLWRGSLEQWPSALAHRNLAAVLLQEGRRPEAAEHLRAAADLKPIARYSLGVELFEQGRSSEAIVELRRAVQEFPNHPTIALEGRRVLARALQQEGRYMEAAEMFGQIAAMTPDDVAPRIARADALLAAGDLTAAHQEYARILAMHPGHPGAMTNDGLALLRMGRAPEAIPLLRAVAERQPGVAAYMNLASAAAAAGRPADAAEAVCQAVAAEPHNPAPRQFLADLQRAASAARVSLPECSTR
jgi:tetratricopeptide (TPR) repeat protein